MAAAATLSYDSNDPASVIDSCHYPRASLTTAATTPAPTLPTTATPDQGGCHHHQPLRSWSLPVFQLTKFLATATSSQQQQTLSSNGHPQHIDANVPVALERHVFLFILQYANSSLHQQHGNDPRDSDDGQWQEQTTIRIFCTK